MLNPIVLRSVTQPAKVIMACPKATALAFSVGVMSFVFSHNILIGLWVILLAQSAMIYFTYKDPYFMNVWLVFTQCPKTKNYQFIKGNRYDP